MLTLLILFGILAAVAVGLGAWKGSQGWRALQEQKQAERYQEALDTAPAAAESAAAAVLSYDYRSLEADRDAAAKFLSDGYREEYVDTFDKLVVESATQTKAAVEAQVLASAAMNSGERDPSKVPVLLFVNQTTSSAASADTVGRSQPGAPGHGRGERHLAGRRNHVVLAQTPHPSLTVRCLTRTGLRFMLFAVRGNLDALGCARRTSWL